MKKKTLAVILFAITSVIFLMVGMEEWVIGGGPIHYAQIGLAVTFFAIAVAIRRQSAER